MPPRDSPAGPDRIGLDERTARPALPPRLAQPGGTARRPVGSAPSSITVEGRWPRVTFLTLSAGRTPVNVYRLLGKLSKEERNITPGLEEYYSKHPEEESTEEASCEFADITNQVWGISDGSDRPWVHHQPVLLLRDGRNDGRRYRDPVYGGEARASVL